MLFEKLRKNKGIVSSKLGKELAEEVLNGNEVILHEAIKLVTYDLQNEKEKNIRAGAAKILEKVSEKKPEMVSPYLSEIYKAFEAKEPQTRWMLMMTYGYCADINSETAATAIDFAKSYLSENSGVCLSGAAEVYLGRIGATSEEFAQKAFPILLDAYDTAGMNEIDWIFEAFIMLIPKLTIKQREEVFTCAYEYNHASKKSTQKRREKLMKLAKVE
ncbi:MAG TPA: hypothetical protein DDX92_01995 [Flavobacteriales bacterium]|jgi:hypothetical protein|nr:hypothetical protein [Flavobacteriales bacterium]